MRTLYIMLGRIGYILLLPLIRLVIRRTKRVYVVVKYQDEVLLVKNWLARQTWRLPGGGISRGERPVDAACRELHEELRISVNPESLQFLTEGRWTTDRLEFHYTVFEVTLSIRPHLKVDRFEIIDCRFFKVLPAHDVQEELVALLKK